MPGRNGLFRPVYSLGSKFICNLGGKFLPPDTSVQHSDEDRPINYSSRSQLLALDTYIDT